MNDKKFIVNVVVDAHVDVEIFAGNIEEAMEKARMGLYEYDRDEITIIEDSPVNIEGDGEFRDFY